MGVSRCPGSDGGPDGGEGRQRLTLCGTGYPFSSPQAPAPATHSNPHSAYLPSPICLAFFHTSTHLQPGQQTGEQRAFCRLRGEHVAAVGATAGRCVLRRHCLLESWGGEEERRDGGVGTAAWGRNIDFNGRKLGRGGRRGAQRRTSLPPPLPLPLPATPLPLLPGGQACPSSLRTMVKLRSTAGRFQLSRLIGASMSTEERCTTPAATTWGGEV